MAYNSDPNVFTLAEALVQDANLKSVLYSKTLLEGSKQFDDFSFFEGGEGSGKPVIRKTDLSKKGGDKMVFTVMSQLAGPGVRGETELTGNESKADFHTFSLTVDFWRDAFAPTKKMLEFMTVGSSIEAATNQALRHKLGLKRQRDAMICMRQKGSGNTLRPNGRRTLNAIEATDTLDPEFASWAKNQAQRLGARPLSMTRDKNRSPLMNYIIFATDNAMLGVREYDAYQDALNNAMNRGEENPLFTGRLVPWNNVAWFEHIVVDPDYDDVKGSPLAPRLTLGVACNSGDADASIVLKASSSNTKNLYTQDFFGYRYRFWEGSDTGAILDADTTVYYAWVITPDGYVGFISYTGSTDNNGNQIAVKEVLTARADGGGFTKGATTLGDLVLGDGASTDAGTGVITLGTTGRTVPTGFTYTDKFPVGSVVLQANSQGTLIGTSFLMGSNALCRGYGSIEMQKIEEKRDYGFVHGFGYETIFGQAPMQRTDGITNNYLILQHAIEVPGYPVPAKIAAVA